MQGVLFDFDGIIIDSEWPVFQSWVRLFKREGEELALEDYVQCIGSDFGTWSPEELLEKATGKTFDWDVENAKRQVEIESDLEGVEPLKGVIELLKWLEERGVPSAIVSSSTHRWVDGWVETLKLGEYFQAVICREDAMKVKPDPELYLNGARALGIEPEKCLVIEDSLNGVKSGNSAGCLTYALPSRLTSVVDFAIADEEFENYKDMHRQIESLFEHFTKL